MAKPMRESEIIKEMKRLGIRHPLEATEHDQSLNDATRRDINRLLEEHGGQIAGLKLWKFDVKRGSELKEICNFGVDYVFKAEDMTKVEQLVAAYRRDGRVDKFMGGIGELAIYSCLWV